MTIQEFVDILNDKMKELLIVEKPDGTVDIDYSKLSEALKHAGTIDEENAVIEMFLRHKIETDTDWNAVKFEDVEPYLDVLTKWCSELGLKEIVNPYLNFIPLYYKHNPGAKLTKDNMIDLNNLYAQGEITKENLMGKDDSGHDNLENNILFNKELYTFADAEKMVKYWNWLSNAANLKKMNWEEISKLSLTNSITGITKLILKNGINDGGAVESATGEMLNVLPRLFYINGRDGKMNSPETLEKLLAAGSVGMGSNQKKQGDKAKITNSNAADVLTKTIADFGKKYSLGEVELKAIFADALSELGL